MIKPTFFKLPAKLHDWYLKNHDKKQELLIGFYKKHSGRPSILYQEALDEALFFGWIDGIRKSIDDVSYSIRFTPRKKNSIWSAVNIRRVGELSQLGRMHPAGLQTFQTRDLKRAGLYSFEQTSHELASAYEKKFKANKNAWKFFLSKPPSYRKPAIHWVMSAKQEVTRLRRLDILIHDSERERSIALLRRKPG
jgi:uncharacterized protein YdeI (YjbR/CyaY-like superfamily)